MHRLNQEAKLQQKVTLHPVSRRAGVPGVHPGTCCVASRTHPGWHLEFNAKMVTYIPSLPDTASFFMFCDDHTHLYLRVVDMPRAVTEVRSMRDAARNPEHCPWCHFCLGTSIPSDVSHMVLTTVRVLPGVGIVLRNGLFGSFAVQSHRDPQLSTTHSRVLLCTLPPPPRNPPLGLLYGAFARVAHPTGKAILKGFQGGNTREGEPGAIWQR